MRVSASSKDMSDIACAAYFVESQAFKAPPGDAPCSKYRGEWRLKPPVKAIWGLRFAPCGAGDLFLNQVWGEEKKRSTPSS